MDDEPKRIAAQLARLHEESPAFRQLMAEDAPLLDAMLRPDSARRLVPLGLALIVAGLALAALSSGPLLRWGALAGAVVGAGLIADYVRKTRRL